MPSEGVPGFNMWSV